MDNQTVLKMLTPPPQQSVALAPQAGQRRKRPKLTTDLDDANHGDSTKEAIVAVLVENTDGDPGDLVVEGDRVSSPFMGGVKLAVSFVSVELESCVHACQLSAHNSGSEFDPSNENQQTFKLRTDCNLLGKRVLFAVFSGTHNLFADMLD